MVSSVSQGCLMQSHRGVWNVIWSLLTNWPITSPTLSTELVFFAVDTVTQYIKRTYWYIDPECLPLRVLFVFFCAKKTFVLDIRVLAVFSMKTFSPTLGPIYLKFTHLCTEQTRLIIASWRKKQALVSVFPFHLFVCGRIFLLLKILR